MPAAACCGEGRLATMSLGGGASTAMNSVVRNSIAAGVTYSIAVLCVLFPLGGHGSQAVPVKFATVQRGDLSGIEERREAVIRTPAEWAALWKQHNPGQKPPAIDLTRSMVAGAFLGSRPSGGYTVEVMPFSAKAATWS